MLPALSEFPDGLGAADGKDLVGSIIQYLIYMDEILESVEDRKEWEKVSSTAVYSEQGYEGWLDCVGPEESDWQIKKFADKLKDMTCLLIGCTREDLEDRDFKETPLGENWKKYSFKYGLDDYSNSTDWWDSYEDALKHLQRIAENTYGRHVDSLNYHLVEKHLTPRDVMQLLGTEGVRNNIHKNAWVNSLMSEYVPTTAWNNFSMGLSPDHDDYLSKRLPKWIITDMRFPNELKAIKDKGGVSIRVYRPKYEQCTCIRYEEGEGCFYCDYTGKVQVFPKDKHPSETALDNFAFDYTIENDGTIGELINKVEDILIDLKIIK